MYFLPTMRKCEVCIIFVMVAFQKAAGVLVFLCLAVTDESVTVVVLLGIVNHLAVRFSQVLLLSLTPVRTSSEKTKRKYVSVLPPLLQLGTVNLF